MSPRSCVPGSPPRSSMSGSQAAGPQPSLEQSHCLCFPARRGAGREDHTSAKVPRPSCRTSPCPVQGDPWAFASRTVRLGFQGGWRGRGSDCFTGRASRRRWKCWRARGGGGTTANVPNTDQVHASKWLFCRVSFNKNMKHIHFFKGSRSSQTLGMSRGEGAGLGERAQEQAARASPGTAPAMPTPHTRAPPIPTLQLSAGVGRGTQLSPAPEIKGGWGVLEGPAASEPGALSQGRGDDGTREAGRAVLQTRADPAKPRSHHASPQRRLSDRARPGLGDVRGCPMPAGGQSLLDGSDVGLKHRARLNHT